MRWPAQVSTVVDGGPAPPRSLGVDANRLDCAGGCAPPFVAHAESSQLPRQGPQNRLALTKITCRRQRGHLCKDVGLSNLEDA